MVPVLAYWRGVRSCYDRGMLGRGRDWLRWLAAALAAIAVVRVGLYLALPALPPPFAWSGSVMLGLALVFLVLPLPHEALLAYRESPEQRPDRPADV
jgi:peptidoglycan/LPS O-acetylase OafA/YrhL